MEILLGLIILPWVVLGLALFGIPLLIGAVIVFTAFSLLGLGYLFGFGLEALAFFIIGLILYYG